MAGLSRGFVCVLVWKPTEKRAFLKNTHKWMFVLDVCLWTCARVCIRVTVSLDPCACASEAPRTGIHSAGANTEQSWARDDIYDLSHSATCFPKRRPFKCHIHSSAPPFANCVTTPKCRSPTTQQTSPMHIWFKYAAAYHLNTPLLRRNHSESLQPIGQRNRNLM